MKKTYPYITFFLVKYEKRNVTYKEIYLRCLKETTNYYNKFGKEGFLSEKMYLKDVNNIAERNAKREYEENQHVTASMEKVVIDEENEKEVKSLIENRKDFIRWIDPKENIEIELPKPFV